MTDQFEELFAAARSAALAQVRPPGAVTARQTVRRRRIGATMTAAVVLVSAVTAVAIIEGRGPDDVTQPARPPAPAGDLSAWTNNATLAAGVDHSAGPAEVLTSTGAHEIRATEPTIGGGTYSIAVACAGEGAMTLFFDLGPALTTTVVVPCAWPTRAMHTSITVPPSGNQVQVRAVPDTAAAGWSAVAYQMTLSSQDRERLAMAAVAALPGDPGAATTTARFLTGQYGFQHAPVSPGRNRAWFNCIGAGTVRLTVDLVTTGTPKRTIPAGHAELTCTPTATTGSVTFTVPATGIEAVDAALIPDQVAVGRTTAAIRIQPL